MSKTELTRQKILLYFVIILLLIFAGISVYQWNLMANPAGAASNKLERIIEQQVYVENSAGIESVKKFSKSVFNVVLSEEKDNFMNLVSDQKRRCFDNLSTCNELALMLTSDGVVLYGGKHQDKPMGQLFLIDSEGKSYQAVSLGKYKGFSIWRLLDKGDLLLAEDKRTKFFTVEPVMLEDLRLVEVGQRIIGMSGALSEYQEIFEGVVHAKIKAGDSVMNLNNSFQLVDLKFGGGDFSKSRFEFDLGGGLIAARSKDGQILFSNEIQSLISRMEVQDGSFEVVNLGLSCIPINRELSQILELKIDYGCLVASGLDSFKKPLNQEAVKVAGVADKAGIRFGDIVLEFENKSLLNNDFGELILGTVVGSKPEIVILRGGETIKLFVQF